MLFCDVKDKTSYRSFTHSLTHSSFKEVSNKALLLIPPVSKAMYAHF